MLCNKALQEIVHAAHHFAVTVDFVRAKLFNSADADFLHVTCHNTSLVNFWLKSEALMWAVTYIGVIVFVGLTAYDTQKLKNIGEQIDLRDSSNLRKYAILGALTLYLDFINLFLMLLRIFGNRR